MIHPTLKKKRKEIKLVAIPVPAEMASNHSNRFVQQREAPARGVTQPGASHQLTHKLGDIQAAQSLQQTGDTDSHSTGSSAGFSKTHVTPGRSPRLGFLQLRPPTGQHYQGTCINLLHWPSSTLPAYSTLFLPGNSIYPLKRSLNFKGKKIP